MLDTFNTMAGLQQCESHRQLEGMLLYMGIDTARYEAAVSNTDISIHLSNCKNCSHTPVCDSCVADWNTVSDMGFCNNYQLLAKYRRSLMEEI